MADTQQLRGHAAQVWARFYRGLKRSKAIHKTLRFLGHADALRGVVRIDADGLGLTGSRANQRKTFLRFVNEHAGQRGWQVIIIKLFIL